MQGFLFFFFLSVFPICKSTQFNWSSFPPSSPLYYMILLTGEFPLKLFSCLKITILSSFLKNTHHSLSSSISMIQLFFIITRLNSQILKRLCDLKSLKQFQKFALFQSNDYIFINTIRKQECYLLFCILLQHSYIKKSNYQIPEFLCQLDLLKRNDCAKNIVFFFSVILIHCLLLFRSNGKLQPPNGAGSTLGLHSHEQKQSTNLEVMCSWTGLGSWQYIVSQIYKHGTNSAGTHQSPFLFPGKVVIAGKMHRFRERCLIVIQITDYF